MTINTITKPRCEQCNRDFLTPQALAGHNRFVHGQPGRTPLATRHYVLDQELPELFIQLLIDSFRVVLRETEGQELPDQGRIVRDAFGTVLAYVEKDQGRIVAELTAKFRP